MHSVAFAQILHLLGQPFPGDNRVPVGRAHGRAVGAGPLSFGGETEIRDLFALGCGAQLDRLAKPSLDDCRVQCCFSFRTIKW
jgi:hypothetical protein